MFDDQIDWLILRALGHFARLSPDDWLYRHVHSSARVTDAVRPLNERENGEQSSHRDAVQDLDTKLQI